MAVDSAERLVSCARRLLSGLVESKKVARPGLARTYRSDATGHTHGLSLKFLLAIIYIVNLEQTIDKNTFAVWKM